MRLPAVPNLPRRSHDHELHCYSCRPVLMLRFDQLLKYPAYVLRRRRRDMRAMQIWTVLCLGFDPLYELQCGNLPIKSWFSKLRGMQSRDFPIDHGLSYVHCMRDWHLLIRHRGNTVDHMHRMLFWTFFSCWLRQLQFNLRRRNVQRRQTCMRSLYLRPVPSNVGRSELCSVC